jgi:hypothetical protein
MVAEKWSRHGQLTAPAPEVREETPKVGYDRRAGLAVSLRVSLVRGVTPHHPAERIGLRAIERINSVGCLYAGRGARHTTERMMKTDADAN